jgi:hypothetical protein
MKHLAIVVALAVGMVASAHAADDKPPAVATPGLGEIMTLTQMRHLKLWFAGREKNWELAAYELEELQEGFDDAIKYFPTKDDVPVAQMVKDITPGPMGELKSAVEAKDWKKFAKAFDSLTAACNTCHQGAKKPFIVIRRPTSSPYSNQSFAPVKQTGPR